MWQGWRPSRAAGICKTRPAPPQWQGPISILRDRLAHRFNRI
jgi:hypothetical protein